MPHTNFEMQFVDADINPFMVMAKAILDDVRKGSLGSAKSKLDALHSYCKELSGKLKRELRKHLVQLKCLKQISKFYKLSTRQYIVKSLRKFLSVLVKSPTNDEMDVLIFRQSTQSSNQY